MKISNKIFFIAFLFFSENYFSAKIELMDGSLDRTYSRDETIYLPVKNPNRWALKIHSNAEVFENGQWVAWPYRIEDGRPEAISTSYRVKARGTVVLALIFSSVQPPPIPAGEHPRCEREPLFRLRIIVVDRKNVKSEFYSKPFKVIDPYGICAENGFVR